MTAGVDKTVWLYLRARILLVCDIRLGMGMEELFHQAVCCVIFQSLGYSPFEPWDLGFLESITVWLGSPTLKAMLGGNSSMLVLGTVLTWIGGAGPLRFMPKAFFRRSILSRS